MLTKQEMKEILAGTNHNTEQSVTDFVEEGLIDIYENNEEAMRDGCSGEMCLMLSTGRVATFVD
jgi:hypothetical protein